MARKEKIKVEFPVLDPLVDRTYTQEIVMLAEDGRPITKEKMEYADEVQSTLVNLLMKGKGMEVISVKGKRS